MYIFLETSWDGALIVYLTRGCIDRHEMFVNNASPRCVDKVRALFDNVVFSSLRLVCRK